MNAIRRDEELDNLHSCYVDQWDWEKVITKEDRTIETLESTVQTIFKIIKHMEHEVWYKYPQAVKHLPEHITFITTQELADRYPDKTPKERENLITKEHGCVFLMKIGDKLAVKRRYPVLVRAAQLRSGNLQYGYPCRRKILRRTVKKGRLRG